MTDGSKDLGAENGSRAEVPSASIAVIGLGNIGGGAARNLARAGADVTVFDLDPEKVADIVALGGSAAADVANAAHGKDIVFTSLPGPKQIEAVADDIIPNLAPGAVWVELSTNDLDTANRIATRCEAAGVGLIDAPVSGGPEGAEAGTLAIFIGGADDHVNAAMPALEIIGEKIDHLGPRGAGIVAKIAQVILCYTQTITLIEALLLGAKGGVQPARMLDLIQHSAGTSYCAMSYGPEILAGTYDASFPLSHAAKDLRLAMELAQTLNVDLPFTSEVAELYATAEAEYGSEAAHCLAAQLIERKNDLVLHEA